MAITSTNEMSVTELTACVIIRIPIRADGDLLFEAERQLTQVDGVTEASVDELRSLEPRLSATAVTVDVTVQTAADRNTSEFCETLLERPDVEDVKRTDEASRI